MAAVTLGVKMDEALRERVREAAQSLGRTPHWLIKQAVLQMVEAVERGQVQPGATLVEPASGEGEANDEPIAATAMPAAPQPFLEFAQAVLPQSDLRAAITAAWHRPEPECLPALLRAANVADPAQRERIRERATRLVDGLRAAGLPAGAVGLVVGPTEATYRPLMDAEAVRKVSLTGSTRVGQAMIRDAAATLKRVSMELGGNAPLIVFEDADLEAALDAAVPTKYANAGQVCVTPDRFYVHESLHDRFVEGFAARASALRLGDGLDEGVAMGPLISADRREAVAGVVEDAVAQGARLVAGGVRPRGFNAGHFYEPTVLAEARDDMRVMAEENFGPVAAIARFAAPEEAYGRANASPLGLSAYAFTRSARRAREAVAELRAGMVGVNSFALAAAEAPFGGVGHSGMGREGGIEAIRDYLDVKLVQTVM